MYERLVEGLKRLHQDLRDDYILGLLLELVVLLVVGVILIQAIVYYFGER